MKKNIHPEYHDNAKIICSCGAVLHTGSTQKEMHVEICSACHPFYTGKKKVVDATGRVDRFKKLAEKSATKKAASKTKKSKTKKDEAKKAKKK
ncbi:MAG TPA: 50S ribosomal protein L31 [Candidatus Moranbacteria bacterium]|nr:50S ribosomal protein L31 [Candidatus Moranbacteria bacterium]HRZ33680.1 50S ribosomal protein L31 [Candidatus Moranbacteria bacterium]